MNLLTRRYANTGACELTCLCPTGRDAPPAALVEHSVSADTCMTHIDDYVYVRSPGELEHLEGELVSAGSVPATIGVTPQCGECTVTDA